MLLQPCRRLPCGRRTVLPVLVSFYEGAFRQRIDPCVVVARGLEPLSLSYLLARCTPLWSQAGFAGILTLHSLDSRSNRLSYASMC